MFPHPYFSSYSTTQWFGARYTLLLLAAFLAVGYSLLSLTQKKGNNHHPHNSCYLLYKYNHENLFNLINKRPFNWNIAYQKKVFIYFLIHHILKLFPQVVFFRHWSHNYHWLFFYRMHKFNFSGM